MEFGRSEAAFASAQQYLAGGVNSPVRAFKAVGGTPVFINEANGARITDLDGNQIDQVISWSGPVTLAIEEAETPCCYYNLVSGSLHFEISITNTDMGCTGEAEGSFAVDGAATDGGSSTGGRLLHVNPDSTPHFYNAFIRWTFDRQIPTLTVPMSCPDPDDNHTLNPVVPNDFVLLRTDNLEETSDITVLSGDHLNDWGEADWTTVFEWELHGSDPE
jgi:hypothetical protein